VGEGGVLHIAQRELMEYVINTEDDGGAEEAGCDEEE
tara:strand:- start:334 stop:444 length:111 start_codon:yes stop_codon:yes gene_type:complete